MRLQQRFVAGADCAWLSIDRSPQFYCRRNGRAFRLEPTRDKRWKLFRIGDRNDAGVLIVTYSGRGEANKVLAKLAYEPEPRW